jgi:hypothetical protein
MNDNIKNTGRNWYFAYIHEIVSKSIHNSKIFIIFITNATSELGVKRWLKAKSDDYVSYEESCSTITSADEASYQVKSVIES